MPTFSPAEGAVPAGSTVTISTTTPGATIYYTTDGTDPGPSSTQYTAPIAITAAVTIKAVATAPGFDNSPVGSAAYTLTVVPTAVDADVQPRGGSRPLGNHGHDQHDDGRRDDPLHDRRNGPGPSSTQYTAPIAITAAVTIKAIATASGFADSAAGSAAYTILAPAATPTFDPEAGAVLSGTDGHHQHDDGRRDDPLHDRRNGPRAVVDAVHRARLRSRPQSRSKPSPRRRDSPAPPWHRPRTRSWLRRRRRRSVRGREPSSPAPWSPSARRLPARRSVTRQTERTRTVVDAVHRADCDHGGSHDQSHGHGVGVRRLGGRIGDVHDPGSGRHADVQSPRGSRRSWNRGDDQHDHRERDDLLHDRRDRNPQRRRADRRSSTARLFRSPRPPPSTRLRSRRLLPLPRSARPPTRSWSSLPAATPTFSPAAGVVSSGTTVTISSATAGATIYYTTDGTQPGTSAGGSTSVYSTPIAITAATTINAIAVASGFLTSGRGIGGLHPDAGGHSGIYAA